MHKLNDDANKEENESDALCMVSEAVFTLERRILANIILLLSFLLYREGY